MAAHSAVPAGLRRYLLSRPGFYTLLAAAVAIQAAKGLLKRPTLTPFDRSYWFVTYAEGFTRRGLGGATLRAATGSVATVTQAEAVAWATTAIVLALVARLVIVALRRDTPTLDLAAIALCCSPLVIPFVITQRRPDQLGFIVFLAYGLALYRFPERASLAAGIAGLALAAAVFVQDAVFLEVLPWVGVITLVAAVSEGWSARVAHRLVLSCAPGVVAAAISLLFGRLDAAQVQALKMLAAVRHPWVTEPGVNSNFFYLGDTVSEAAARVTTPDAIKYIVGSVVATLVVFAVQAALMSGFRRPTFVQIDRTLAIAIRIALLSTVLTLGVLLTIALDFARWMTVYGFFATVTLTLGRLYAEPQAAEDRRQILTVPVLVAAAYLLLLWPIADWFDYEKGIRFLLLLPR